MFRAQPRADGAPTAQPIERQVDDRRRVEREELRDQQTAEDGVAERLADLRAGSVSERERHRAEQRGECRHHDRPEAEQRGLIDRLLRAQALGPFGMQSKIDHHDGILLDDADQQDDADERNDA